MPNTKSAAKRHRQSTLRRARNRAARSDVKTRNRKVLTALEEGQKDEAQSLFREAVKNLDQAAAKKIIHRNAAARLKSRLAARMKQGGAKQPAKQG
jgi:small subunit ribosomal protein S20